MKVLKKLAMNFEAYLCAIAIAVMSVVVFVQVVFRFIVKSSLPWSEELSRYSLWHPDWRPSGHRSVYASAA